MAKGKKSFLLYCDTYETFKSLNDKEAGRLIKQILGYVNDLNPTPPDKLTKLLFEPIKQQLKRDLIKYEESKDRFSKAGTASAIARRLSKPQLYVLRFFNEDENFIKIGITDDSIGRRFSSAGEGNNTKLPYKFEILHQFFHTDISISLVELENKIQKNFTHIKYFPKIKFPGYTECFTLNNVNEVLQFITTFNNVQQRSTKSTVTDNVTVTVTDTVTDNVIISLNKKPEMVDQFFLDFPKSSYMERIAMDLKINKQILINSLPSFRTSSSVSYPQMKDFADHFKRWYKKVNLNQPQTKRNQ